MDSRGKFLYSVVADVLRILRCVTDALPKFRIITLPMLDSSQFALGKTVLKLSEPAIKENSEADLIPETSPSHPSHPTQSSEDFSQPMLSAMTRLVEIVAELRSQAGGWPSDLPKTSENLIPYVLEEAYDLLDAIDESPSNLAAEATQSYRQTAIYPSHPAAPLIMVDDLIPRLLWDVVKSSYDVMQLIGGVNAQLVRSNEPAANGLLRLVVGLTVSSTEHPWFVDLATNNAGVDRSDLHICDADALIHCPDVMISQESIAAGDAIAQLQQQIASINPELAKFMQPRPVQWLHPNRQWLTGSIELTMDLEFMPHLAADPRSNLPPDGATPGEPDAVNFSASSDSDSLTGDLDLSHTRIRLARPAIFQASAKIPIQQALVSLLPPIQKLAEAAKNSPDTMSSGRAVMLTNDAASENPNLIRQVVTAAYDLVETWEFPWSEGEVAIDECLHRLLWQTITSSYAVMQLIGTVEAMVLTPGEDWEIGILRLLAIFEMKLDGNTMTIDLSTGQPLDIHRILTETTIVRSPAIEFCQQPVMVQHLLNRLNQQIQTATPAFEWLMNGVDLDWFDPASHWRSGCGQLRLAFEFITA